MYERRKKRYRTNRRAEKSTGLRLTALRLTVPSSRRARTPTSTSLPRAFPVLASGPHRANGICPLKYFNVRGRSACSTGAGGASEPRPAWSGNRTLKRFTRACLFSRSQVPPQTGGPGGSRGAKEEPVRPSPEAGGSANSSHPSRRYPTPAWLVRCFYLLKAAHRCHQSSCRDIMSLPPCKSQHTWFPISGMSTWKNSLACT